MKLDEIADGIRAHLRRFEADPKVNRRTGKVDGEWVTLPVGSTDGTGRYWCTNAYKSGARVAVVYISYQGSSKLKKADALAYLEWLDAGNVGEHWKVGQ